MANQRPSQAFRRLTSEQRLVHKEPLPDLIIAAKPLEATILEWHALVRGPPDTPFEGGEYWVKFLFPEEFPFAPPAIYMLTPSGRFKPDERICLTGSRDLDDWNPSWTVSQLTLWLLSFMASNEFGPGHGLNSRHTKGSCPKKQVVEPHTHTVP